MSGFCLESCHFSEAISDCVVCLEAASEDDDDDLDRASRAFGIERYVGLEGGDVRADPGDYLDACGRRISETMLASMRAKPAALTLDRLLDMTPMVNGQDVIRMAARHLLLTCVKSQDNVHDVFFSGHRKDGRYTASIDRKWFDFDRLACLYVCQAICKVKDEYRFWTMLDEARIDQELSALYSSPHWKKIGFAFYTMLFQDLVKDEGSKVPFSAYLDQDRQTWARKLSEKVRQKQWVYANLISPVVQGKSTGVEYNRDLNIIFIKLHLLDPTTVTPTFDYLRKAVPDLNLELVTTNYLGGPLEWSLIRSDVQAAIQKPTYADKQSRLTLGDVEVFHGVEVCEFVMNEAKDRHLWTGKHPDNRRVTQFKDRCLVM